MTFYCSNDFSCCYVSIRQKPYWKSGPRSTTFAKKKAMRYTKEQIGRWVSEWEESGQSIIRYCDGKPFDKSTFYNWRKKSTASSVTKQKSKFVPLQVNPAFIPQLSIHYPNGVRVDVHMLMSIEDVRVLTGC